MPEENTMKLWTALLAACFLVTASTAAWAGDYHVPGKLKCAQCHVMHGQQTGDYITGGEANEIGSAAPYEGLLRNEVNDLCLTCHDTYLGGHNSDVFGANTDGEIRQAGGLNIEDGHEWANDPGYETIDGHTLYSTRTAPGGTFQNSAGLNCVDCHMPHGHVPTQYRNLWTSTNPLDKFNGKNVTYSAGGTPVKSKDVFETASTSHAVTSVWFNEPDQTKSAYANWCQSCHTSFHGDASIVGGQSGGWTFAIPVGWKRHPQADVNIGHEAGADFVSSLTRYQDLTNKVKVMSNLATTVAEWATATDVTPSCFSCHKGHGNKNGFGLIMMGGTGAVTEEGDDAVTAAYAGDPTRITAPTPLCQQCHIQGVDTP
jgi:hypothetical protein